MLWEQYVFRRGPEVLGLWDDIFRSRKPKLLFITGCGFDVRVTSVLRTFLENARAGRYELDDPAILLVELSGYELDQDLRELTIANRTALRELFEPIGTIFTITVELAGGTEEHRTSRALREATQNIREHIVDRTDIVLDVSSLPRVVYLALMTSLLGYLVPDVSASNAKVARGVNLQILVAEDAALDSRIRSEDPSESLVTIPGFGGGFNVASMDDWPVVWFPMLGEGRTNHFEKVRRHAPIPDDAEVCPVLPHPSRDPRRGDMLLLEYRRQLFDVQAIPMTNIVYAHESNPFEAYRQLRRALERYQRSLAALGGSRLLVTPLSSKLMTVAAGLACFEMKPPEGVDTYAVGLPYAAPTRYSASSTDLLASQAVLSALLLTGSAYSVA
jgi:hypothetical protein